MKNTALCLSLALVFCAASIASAAEGLSKNELKLQRVSSDLDKAAIEKEGRKTVEKRISSEYNVDADRVKGLRDQKMGYGEISIVLALAQRMPDGITDKNVQSILALRQGPPVMGWGRIAKEQGVKLGKMIRSVKRVGSSVRKQEKADRKMRMKREQKARKSIRREISQRNERPSRPANRSRSDRPSN